VNRWALKQGVKKLLSRVNFLRKPWWSPPSSSLLLDTDSDFSGQYSEVYAQRANKLGLPTFIGIDEFSFMSDPVDGFESIGVYKLENATVCCSFGIVMDTNSKIITQTSWNRVNPSDIRLPSHPEKLRTSRLTGVTAVIATESSDGNYGHFLLDSIGRLAVFEEHSPNVLSEIDHLIVSGPEKDWKKRLLLSFGVPLEKIVWIDDNKRYLCDTLLASSFPGAKRTYPFWLCDFFRQSKAGKSNVEKEATGEKRRLFFVRKGPSRKLTNSKALFSLAERYGFEQYFPEDVNDSRSDFRQAEVVIAPHGAGLADISFMSPGSKVLELMPSDHRHCYFFTLAKAASLDYTVIVGKSDGERGDNARGPSPYDFGVNEEHLATYLNSHFPLAKE
jgi:hypothetical protein